MWTLYLAWHNNVLDTAGKSHLLNPLYFGYLCRLTILSFKNGFNIKILYTFHIWKISQYGSPLDPSSNFDILPFLVLFFLNWISYINNSNFLKDIFIRNSFFFKLSQHLMNNKVTLSAQKKTYFYTLGLLFGNG